nr:ATP-dependent DNA helicase PIF1-like [Tanacetum cinerariifolium]
MSIEFCIVIISSVNGPESNNAFDDGNKVGDEELGEANDGEMSIDVPEELLIDAVDDPVTSIIDFTYPNLLNDINNPTYFQEKAILAPTNEVVDIINDHLLNKFPEEEMVYLSCDSTDKTKCGSAIDEVVFSPKFINGLKFSGFKFLD